MDTLNAAVPQYNKISIIGIWVESVLYGFNCIVYAFCMFVLLWGGRATCPRVLVLASTILFVLCTVHIAASLQQLLEAFVYVPADIPNYSNLYWSNSTPLLILKDAIYITLVFVQDLVLIWRLYVVFNRNWKIVIVPILVETAHMGTAYAATIKYASNPGIGLYNSLLSRLGLTAWALDISINVSLTLAIAARLWWMGNAVASLNASHPTRNRYLVVMNMVIGSGSLFAGVTTAMLGLYVTNSPVTLTALDIGCQLAVLTPLLIVVKVGLGSTHDLQREYETVSKFRVIGSEVTEGNPFRQGLSTREPENRVLDLDTTFTNPRSFVIDVKV